MRYVLKMEVFQIFEMFEVESNFYVRYVRYRPYANSKCLKSKLKLEPRPSKRLESMFISCLFLCLSNAWL